MKLIEIKAIAPISPRCFTSRDQWVEYLAAAQDHHREERRPFHGERYRPTFSFCKDCEAHYRDSMSEQGRCDFDAYVARTLADQTEGQP